MVKEATRCPDTARPTDKTNCYDPLSGATEARGTATAICHGVGRGERVGRGLPPPGRKDPSPPSPPLRVGGVSLVGCVCSAWWVPGRVRCTGCSVGLDLPFGLVYGSYKVGVQCKATSRSARDELGEFLALLLWDLGR